MRTPALALVVDDCPGLARHLQRQLQELGLEAEVPRSETELLARCGAAAFIFVELQLLHRNGFGLVRRLGHHAGGALILLSGTGRGTDLQWGLRAGASALLTRPLRQAHLRDCLRTLDATRGLDP